jgi:hypothetical protein
LRNTRRALDGFTHEWATLERPSHRLALSLLGTWDALAPEGGIVIGRHFPARTFAALPPDVMLFERVRDARDFRIRPAGFAVRCFYGRDLRGAHLCDLYGARDRAELCAAFGTVLAGGFPRVHLASLRDGPQTVARREIVCVPVTASDGCTKLVLAVSFWAGRTRID